MLEILLRFIAVLFLAIMLIAFGVYFAFPWPDRFQNDFVEWSGGVMLLLSGLFSLGFSMLVLMRQVQEFGVAGLDSDVAVTPVPAPAARGGAAAAAAAAPADDTETEEDAG